jgi:hypothetical protein
VAPFDHTSTIAWEAIGTEPPGHENAANSLRMQDEI